MPSGGQFWGTNQIVHVCLPGADDLATSHEGLYPCRALDSCVYQFEVYDGTKDYCYGSTQV